MKLEREFWQNERSFLFNLITKDGWKIAIRFNTQTKKGFLYFDAAEVLSEMFKGLLSPAEIIEAFGEFEVPQDWRIALGNRGLTKEKLTKKDVKKATRIISKWWTRGLRKCDSILKEKDLEGWLIEEFKIWEGGEDEQKKYHII